MANVYESAEQVGQYCEFHYGGTYFEVPNFPKVCAEHALAPFGGAYPKKVLDVGCAVGRSTLAFAQAGAQALGVDFSHAFVDTAEKMRTQGRLDWDVVREGRVTVSRQNTLEALGLAQAAERAAFAQGDACALDAGWSGYDLIAGFNLLCRLPEPRVFLEAARARLNPNGVLALTTPATWLEDFTAPEHWLGGYYDEHGRSVSTFEGLQRELGPHFELVGKVQELPFVIRETAHKYQHSFALFTAWRLRS